MMVKYYLSTFMLKHGFVQLPSVTNAPLILLGKAYIVSKWTRGIEGYIIAEESASTRNIIHGHYPAFLEYFQSRFWFSYRENLTRSLIFPFETDAGWGCMIRSGQMMMAQALCCIQMGRDWITTSPGDNITYHDKILGHFIDINHKAALFSIFRLVKTGNAMGMTPGTWFTPSAIGEVISKICFNAKLHEFHFVVCREGSIYRDQITHGSQSWKPTILYIPLRLGLDKLNPVYIPQILQIFKWKQSLGFVGGRPRSAYYFVGSQDEDLFYLDPHIIQESQGPIEELRHTYHSSVPSKMSIRRLDPCIGIGFLCLTRDEFDDICEKFQNLCENRSYNIVSVFERVPAYLDQGHSSQGDSEHYTEEVHEDNEDFTVL